MSASTMSGENGITAQAATAGTMKKIGARVGCSSAYVFVLLHDALDELKQNRRVLEMAAP